MRYLYAMFKNYIGFYNGLNLEKLEIDFTKCKNHIILISGMNGCGKTTLLNSLSPFPDPSSAYVPNKDGGKILKLESDGDIYEIKIVSQSDSKGGRKQTKAFISKNGLEMNDNGNISSYKEIIFSEFDLDSNYISLTKMSSIDRGIGDKTPSERKKFVSAIVNNLEVYNDIYKTLNKKSLIFKSHINTIHTKIQNIGNKEDLEVLLNSLKTKNDNITSNIMSLNNKIVELQTRTSINQEEAKELNNLKSDEELILRKISTIKNEIDILKRKTKIEESDIEKKYIEDNDLILSYTKSRDEAKLLWKSESDKMNTIVSSINELEASLESSNNIDMSISDKYNESNNNIIKLKKNLVNCKIDDNIDLIINLSSLIDFYTRFIKNIDAFYDGLDISNLEYISLKYDKNRMNILNKKLNDNYASIESKNNELSSLQSKVKSLAVLENRPNKCNIDTCPFISDAVKLKKELGKTDIIAKLSKLQDEILELSKKTTEILSEIEICSFCDRKYTEFQSIRNEVLEFNSLFKLFNDELLSNINKFDKAVSVGNTFNFQRDPRILIDGLNYLKQLSAEYNLFNILEAQYIALKDKLSLIENNKKSINKLKEELDKCNASILENKSIMDKYDSLILSIQNNIGFELQYKNCVDDLNNALKELKPISEKIQNIESKSSTSIQCINKINELQSQINNLTMESKPLVSDIERISGQLTLLDSYYQEYELYKVKYNTINTLKKYCSPTNGGIQVLFIQLYMSKTLEIANQILGLLFGGNYKLLDFVINSDEFRIPFVGYGLPVDDISSGSNSQVCIMSLAINLALFHQASSKFNIAQLDEIDGPLDGFNRYEFVNALYQMIPILNIEQMFMISHSMEIDASAVDIIKLKSYDNQYEQDQTQGNIIYDYSKDAQTSI